MPSAANFSRREAERLASLTFFLDYQIGRYVVAEALRAAGAHVEVHIDHFGQAAPDLEWIPEVGRREWVLIAKDENIRRNPLERAAYEDARVRAVVTGIDMSGNLIDRSPPSRGVCFWRLRPGQFRTLFCRDQQPARSTATMNCRK